MAILILGNIYFISLFYALLLLREREDFLFSQKINPFIQTNKPQQLRDVENLEKIILKM